MNYKRTTLQPLLNCFLGKEYHRVLLIDDFVGSGATLNITAKKLKDAGVQEVIGCAFVGNADLKYEVINEV